MRNYEIAQQTGTCTVTQRRLEPGEEFFAVLFEHPEGFQRHDYCLEAWSGPPEGNFSYWKSRMPPDQKEKKRIWVGQEVLIDLFCRLGDAHEEVKQHFRFVLALLLMRKKLLKYEHTHQDGAQERWQMRLSTDQTVHRVLNPHLSDAQIEAVSKELGAILHGDEEGILQDEEVSSQA